MADYVVASHHTVVTFTDRSRIVASDAATFDVRLRRCAAQKSGALCARALVHFKIIRHARQGGLQRCRVAVAL